MKLIMNLILVIVLVFSLTTISYASTPADTAQDNNTGVLLNDPTLTKDNIKKNEEAAVAKYNKLAQKALSEVATLAGDPDGIGYYISVTNYEQAYSNYCGPASVRQSLSFHKIKSGSGTSLPSQATLANIIGISPGSGGSATTAMRTALNQYSSTFGFSSNGYVVDNIADQSNPVGFLESTIKSDLRYETNAPILLIETEYLPRYQGHASRHYNTVSGYSYEYASGDKRVRMVDPNYQAAYYGVYLDPLGSTTVSGVGKAVYKADVNGTNYVMCV